MDTLPPELLSSIPCAVVKDENYPHHIHITSNGRRIAVGTDFGVIVRSLPGFEDDDLPAFQVYDGATSAILICAMKDDGSLIVGCDGKGTIYTWISVKKTVSLSTYQPEGMKHVSFKDISISRDGRYVSVVGIDRYSKLTGYIFFADAGISVGKLKHQPRGSLSVAMHPTEPICVTGGFDGSIAVNRGIPYKGGSILDDRHTQSGDKSFCVRWNHMGSRLASLSEQGEVILWAFHDESKELETRLTYNVPRTTREGRAYALAWSPNDEFIAVAHENRVTFLRAENGNVVESLKLTTEPRGLVWSASHEIVLCDKMGHLKGYPLDANQHVPRISNKSRFTWTGPIGTPVCYARDNQTVVMGTSNGALMFVKYNSAGIESYSTMVPRSMGQAIRFILASGSIVICGTSDGTIHILSYDWSGALGYAPTSVMSPEEILMQPAVCSGRADTTPSTDEGSSSPNPPGQSNASSRQCSSLSAHSVQSIGMHVKFLMKYELFATILGGIALDDFKTAVVLAESFQGPTNAYAIPFLPVVKEGQKLKPYDKQPISGHLIACASSEDGTRVALALDVAKVESSYNLDKLSHWDEDIGDWRAPDEIPSRYLIELFKITEEGQWEFLRALPYHKSRISCLAMTHDGGLVVSSDIHNNLYVSKSDVTDEELMSDPSAGMKLIGNEWNEHCTSISSLAWSSDNQMLITGGLDGHCFLHSTEFPDWSETLRHAHKGGISASFFMHNNIVVTCGNDSSMKVWAIDIPGATTEADGF